MGRMKRAMLAVVLAACASGGGGEATTEIDGSWVRSFAADRDAAYHAALGVFTAEGYVLHSANPLAGTFTAKSPAGETAGVVDYRLAHVVVESLRRDLVRIRIGIVRTREPSGAGRRPNNDRPVRDRAVYEALFDRIGSELAK